MKASFFLHNDNNSNVTQKENFRFMPHKPDHPSHHITHIKKNIEKKEQQNPAVVGRINFLRLYCLLTWEKQVWLGFFV